MPVYNETSLLPISIPSIEPYVDEMVFVDGGPDGPSEDGTADMVKSFGTKVVYKSGTFRTPNGAWDSAAQRNLGLSAAMGDILLLASADVVFSNLALLCQKIRTAGMEKTFFCSCSM